MKRPKRLGLAFLSLLLLACVGSGYAVQLADLVQRPGFEPHSLRDGGLAILGFEGISVDLSDAQRDAFNYPLFTALRAHHPDVPLTGAKTLRAALAGAGLDESVRYLLASDRTGELPFPALRSAVQGRRFLLSAQLKSDDVDQHRGSSSSADVYCTERAIRVRYRIMDLQTESIAWQGVIRRSDQDCHRITRSHAQGKSLLGALVADLIVDGMTRAIVGTYPAAPATASLAEQAAIDFASVLPGAQNPPTH